MDSGGGSNGSFGADSSGGGGGGGRGGGGGGRGGRGGGGGEGGGAQQQGPEVVVRWENARPVLEATKLQLPPDLADHYAISVTGLPPQMLAAMLTGGGRGRGRDGGARDAGGGGREAAPSAEAPPPEDPAARQKAAVERLLHSVSLTAKGRDPQPADLVRQAFNNQTLIFGFPRQSFPLEAADRDVQFVMKLGMLTLKAKFEPKEMTYKGGLAV
jgi:hypothetical protein